MAARIPTATRPLRRDYAFLVERLIPRRHLTQERDAALTRALAGGERALMYREARAALRELVALGLYVELPSQDPRRLVFRSTRTRDRVHLVQPQSEQQASRPTPHTVAQTEKRTQTGIRPPSPTPSPTARTGAAGDATARTVEKQREVPRPERTASDTAGRDGRGRPQPTQAASEEVFARLEPVLQLVALETRLAHLAERLRRILGQIEQLLPGARVRLWHLEGVSEEELGNGGIRALPQAQLEATPHFREALRSAKTRYATRRPSAPSAGDGVMAAAVPLRVGDTPWGILEINWPQGTVQSVASFAPLLQPLARLVELAIGNQTTLEKLVSVDPLTGVYNRAFYERQLTLEMERAHRTNRKFGLLVMDVDDFKSINDRFGHRAGDAVLAEIAHEVRGRMRKIDLIFRYGGEEFVLLLPGAEQQEARRTAERLRAVVGEKRFPVEGAGEGLRVTVSIGVAIYPDDARTQSGLFKHADAALYRAKEQGKNRVVYQ